METMIKDLGAGSAIHALIKGDELKYVEGTITNVSAPRTELPKIEANNFMQQMSMRSVVDVTYNIEGKTFTDVVDVNATMFQTDKTGAITLVASDISPIIRELKATKKKNEDYLKETETGIPKAEKRVEECNAWIAKLDTSFAKEQAIEERFKQIEAQNAELKAQSTETNQLLRQLLSKMTKQ